MRRKAADVVLPCRGRWAVGALVLSCLLAGRAEAQETSKAGQNEHDGFYLRVLSGVGYTRISSGESDLVASGASGTFGLALGYNVARNLIVYAELFDDIAVSPSVDSGGMEQDLGEDVSMGVIGWGAGLAYYFMPTNAYVSATLAASYLTLDEDGEEVAESSWGLGASLVAGKEWWVSDNWGLGAAAHLYLGRIPDGGDAWTTLAAALVVSATYD